MRSPGTQSFSEEFRHHAAQLTSAPARSISELSRKLGVTTTTLRNWKRTVPKEKPVSAGRVLSLEE